MISPAEFYGGAVDVPTGSEDYTITSHRTARVYRLSWSSGSDHEVFLPSTVPEGEAQPDGFVPQGSGAPYLWLVNDGSQTVAVKYTKVGTGVQTLASVAQNETLLVLSDASAAVYYGRVLA